MGRLWGNWGLCLWMAHGGSMRCMGGAKEHPRGRYWLIPPTAASYPVPPWEEGWMGATIGVQLECFFFGCWCSVGASRRARQLCGLWGRGQA